GDAVAGASSAVEVQSARTNLRNPRQRPPSLRHSCFEDPSASAQLPILTRHLRDPLRKPRATIHAPPIGQDAGPVSPAVTRTGLPFGVSTTIAWPCSPLRLGRWDLTLLASFIVLGCLRSPG